jgi:hypothetical protein
MQWHVHFQRLPALLKACTEHHPPCGRPRTAHSLTYHWHISYRLPQQRQWLLSVASELSLSDSTGSVSEARAGTCASRNLKAATSCPSGHCCTATSSPRVSSQDLPLRVGSRQQSRLLRAFARLGTATASASTLGQLPPVPGLAHFLRSCSCGQFRRERRARLASPV